MAGLAAGIAWVTEQGQENLRCDRGGLLQRVVNWVEQAEGWRIAGRWDPGAMLCSISGRPRASRPSRHGRHPRLELRNRHPPRPALVPHVHKALGTFPNGTIRLSPGPFNTIEEIDTLLQASPRLRREFCRHPADAFMDVCSHLCSVSSSVRRLIHDGGRQVRQSSTLLALAIEVSGIEPPIERQP